MPASLEALNLLLLTVRTPRKVQRDGIHLHGLRYFASPFAPYVGEAVIIRYYLRGLAEIRVYHRDEFLCRAVAPDIAATISMQDLQAARNERRRELREQLAARRSLADLLNQPRLAARQPAGAKPAELWPSSLSGFLDRVHRAGWSTPRSRNSTAGSWSSQTLSAGTA